MTVVAIAESSRVTFCGKKLGPCHRKHQTLTKRIWVDVAGSWRLCTPPIQRTADLQWICPWRLTGSCRPCWRTRCWRTSHSRWELNSSQLVSPTYNFFLVSLAIWLLPHLINIQSLWGLCRNPNIVFLKCIHVGGIGPVSTCFGLVNYISGSAFENIRLHWQVYFTCSWPSPNAHLTCFIWILYSHRLK